MNRGAESFDDAVLRAMAKWPNVPDVYGWLHLDQRGRWRLRDEVVTHPGAVAFINRNYTCDERGCWFFQNGPQRVFVSLAYTPWIYEFTPDDDGLKTHTQFATDTVEAVYMDDDGQLLFLTRFGVGVLIDTDAHRALRRLVDGGETAMADEALECAVEALRRGEGSELHFRAWRSSLPVEPIKRSAVAQRFGFVMQPRAP